MPKAYYIKVSHSSEESAVDNPVLISDMELLFMCVCEYV